MGYRERSLGLGLQAPSTHKPTRQRPYKVILGEMARQLSLFPPQRPPWSMLSWSSSLSFAFSPLAPL